MAGSVFVRADLHVHTFAAANEAGPSEPNVAATIAAARSHGISVLAITDHNSARSVREAVALADDSLLIVPGIEISTAEGHLLGLFAPEALDRLEDLARNEVLGLRDLPTGGQQSTRSMADLIDEIQKRTGLAVLAHVDTADGLLARANPAALANILSRPGLAGFEITQQASAVRFSDQDDQDRSKSAWQERKRVLGERAQLAVLMSSDAHSVDEVGRDEATRTLTRLRLDQLTFHATKMAIALRPSARCRLEADLAVNYPHAMSVSFTGGFLDGLSLDLSTNMTCFIGSRGSGKTTALKAIRACLEGSLKEQEDAHPNMPERTVVEYVDSLGSTRRAMRDRYGTSVDADDGTTPVSLATLDLAQNFGMEFLSETEENPIATLEFLTRFVDTSKFDIQELALETSLEENAQSITSTASASTELKKLQDERARLTGNLKAAADAKLVEVASYARILAGEGPLLRDINSSLTDIGQAALANVPDVDALAAALNVDLAERPAADFVGRLKAELQTLQTFIDKTQLTTRADLTKATEPVSKTLAEWKEKHARWEDEIAKRRATLKAAGLTLQVEELERIRARLATVEGDIKKLEALAKTHIAARKGRRQLLADLYAVRERRFEFRQAVTDRIVDDLNKGTATNVSVKWHRAGMLDDYGARLGQLLNMRSPKSERLAANLPPDKLAEMIWNQDAGGLGGIRDGDDVFVNDASGALKALNKYATLFELEVMAIEDRPEVRVRFADDTPGPGRRLADLSLGQARSVLLGFLLSSPGNAPLILDQPEDQLDGPFLAEIVVGYIHAAKERRQIVIATHNPNIVVLGDAELVIPLSTVGGKTEATSAGSVDATETMKEVIRLLEGGMAAFQERATRYGLRVEALPG